MTVLVTGGAGYIGSHVVHLLVDAGESVVVLDDLSTGRRKALPRRTPLIVGDVGNQALVEAVIDAHEVTAIMHFAGSVVVPESVRDPLLYYRNNTANSRSLLEAAVSCGVGQFIFSSTAAVYGNPQRVPADEEAPLQPVSPYGRSKLMIEQILADVAAAHALRFVTLRYFNVAGADPQLRTGQATPAATHLVKAAAEVALGLRPRLEIFGTDYPTPDGTGIRDYIHVVDLARAHLAALAHLRRGGDSLILNCGYGRGYSVRQVVAAMQRAVGRTLPLVEAPRRPGDPAVVVAAADRLRAAFDWRPEYDDIDRIVADALAWERHLQAERERRLGAVEIA